MSRHATFLASVLLVAAAACAESEAPEVSRTAAAATIPVPPRGYFAIPDGTYHGAGTWSDSLGNVGTVTLATTLNGGVSSEAAAYSDGLNLNLSLRYVFLTDSRYDAEIDVGGGVYVKVGHGACSPTRCGTTLETPTARFQENPTYVGNVLLRNGAIEDLATGVWRFYSLVQVRQ